jgi:hypothetical protein
MNKHRHLLIIVFLLCVIALPVFVQAQLNFGGRVVAIIPCNSGLLVYVLTTLKAVIPYMWFTGELPFTMHVPPHPGQQLLGKVGAAVAPCILGTVPLGGGLPILYHGSSL